MSDYLDLQTAWRFLLFRLACHAYCFLRGQIWCQLQLFTDFFVHDTAQHQSITNGFIFVMKVCALGQLIQCSRISFNVFFCPLHSLFEQGIFMYDVDFGDKVLIELLYHSIRSLSWLIRKLKLREDFSLLLDPLNRTDCLPECHWTLCPAYLLFFTG